MDYAHTMAHAEAMKAFHKVYEQTMAKIRRAEIKAQKAAATAAKAAARGPSVPVLKAPSLKASVTNPYFTPY